MSTAKNVINNFMSKGFTLLGHGCYAAVFDSNSDPNLVYKVGVTTSDPFLDYIKLKKDFLENPHFPKIYSTYIDMSNDWYLVTMEKLETVPSHKIGISNEISTLINDSSAITSITIKKTKELVSLTAQINKLVNSIPDIRLDIHQGNVMMRGVTPVITDPLCGLDINSGWELESWFAQKNKVSREEYSY